MHGPEGVYSSSLFRFDPAFFRRYGQSLELGRALVRPGYQRDFLPLLLLWKGIARFVLRHPSIRYLFGPVSLSLDASNLSLRLVTEYLVGQHGSPELEQLIRGRAPLSEKGLGDAPGEAFIRSVRQGLLDYKQLDKLIRAQEQGRGIPILFKHYLKLGGRIAAFHRDTSFNTLDAFLFVDLPQAPENMLRRYMGPTAHTATSPAASDQSSPTAKAFPNIWEGFLRLEPPRLRQARKPKMLRFGTGSYPARFFLLGAVRSKLCRIMPKSSSCGTASTSTVFQWSLFMCHAGRTPG